MVHSWHVTPACLNHSIQKGDPCQHSQQLVMTSTEPWNMSPSSPAEPVGSSAPKFASTDDLTRMVVRSRTAFELTCPAQAMPVPAFRLDRRTAEWQDRGARISWMILNKKAGLVLAPERCPGLGLCPCISFSSNLDFRKQNKFMLNWTIWR